MTWRQWRIDAAKIAFCMVLLLGLGRYLHMDADPATWLFHNDVGYHVDEGYKTYAARYLAEFGQPSWSAADEYPGWLYRSPLTQLSYAALFKLFGVSLLPARYLVCSLYVGVFLLLAWRYNYHLKQPVTAILLLLVALTEPLAFYFSRTALFEVWLACALLITVVAAERWRGRWKALFVMAQGLLVAQLAIKPSAFIYFAPALVVLIGYQLWQRRARLGQLICQPLCWLVVVVLAVAVLVLFVSTQTYWQRYLSLDLWQSLRRLLGNPLFTHSGPFTALYAMTLLRALRQRGLGLFAEPLHGMILSSLIVTPAMLSLFAYTPPRYYVALAPLLALGIAEAFRASQRPAESNADHAGIGVLALRGLLLFSLLWSLLVWSREQFGLLAPLLSMDAEMVSLYGVTRYLAAPCALVALFCAAIKWRPAVPLYIGLLLVCVLVGTAHLLKVVLYPSYQLRESVQMLEDHTERDAVIAGDWAPLFVMGTSRHAYYMNAMHNRPETNSQRKPDYLLLSSKRNDRHGFTQICLSASVDCEAVIQLPDFFNYQLTLYRAHYH